MNIPAEFHELLTAAGYASPNRVLWFTPVHPCPQCQTTIPIWADVCYACNGDTPTCDHATTATPRFTWSALDQKSYTVCLDCFDYVPGEDPGTLNGEPFTPPSVADLKTALDVLEALTPFHELPAPCIDETAQLLNAILLETCPHDRLATGPQCLDCGQRLEDPDDDEPDLDAMTDDERLAYCQSLNYERWDRHQDGPDDDERDERAHMTPESIDQREQAFGSLANFYDR